MGLASTPVFRMMMLWLIWDYRLKPPINTSHKRQSGCRSRQLQHTSSLMQREGCWRKIKPTRSCSINTQRARLPELFVAMVLSCELLLVSGFSSTFGEGCAPPVHGHASSEHDPKWGQVIAHCPVLGKRVFSRVRRHIANAEYVYTRIHTRGYRHAYIHAFSQLSVWGFKLGMSLPEEESLARHRVYTHIASR